MQFTEVSDEEVEKMQFESGRGRGGKNPYGELLDAVKSGKRMRVTLQEGQQLKNLKWGLSQAAKRSEIKLDIRVLADKSGVVVSIPVEVPPRQPRRERPIRKRRQRDRDPAHDLKRPVAAYCHQLLHWRKAGNDPGSTSGSKRIQVRDLTASSRVRKCYLSPC